MDFTTYCVCNPTEQPDPNDWIERWHKGAAEGQELHEYLGLTPLEYMTFIHDPDFIWKVVTARKFAATL